MHAVNSGAQTTVRPAPDRTASPLRGALSRVRRHADAQRIGRWAVRSLHAELTLYPKPGLVSPVDSGSHDDMDAQTFLRSLFALRHAFVDFAAAGREGASFAVLREIGIHAEWRMLRATGGINTHRGAIFCLGLLCAALGALSMTPDAMTPEAIRTTLLRRWGRELARHAAMHSVHSNGARAALRHGVGGARAEALAGFPALFQHGLPTLRKALAAGRDMRAARVDALFALMACMDDTTVLHRAGTQGAALVRESAEDFLAAGGTSAPDWRIRANACHRVFVAHRISPGGAADLLAACCLVAQATQPNAWRQEPHRGQHLGLHRSRHKIVEEAVEEAADECACERANESRRKSPREFLGEPSISAHL